jgi:signal transduction histidine kinase
MAVLPRFAATLVDTLRVPYAAVVLRATPTREAVTVEHGRRTGDLQRFPLVAHGEVIGELLVAPRHPGGRFTAAETGLLHDLAGQAALGADAVRSELDLRRARERLVLAREEERRRLRHDLHDGVASALVGARLLAEAVRADGSNLDTLVERLELCSDETRALIDGLRPAALDEGLGPALRDLTAQLPGDAPRVTLALAGDLDGLPAAVEVATYRIVAEAVTNVVRHARAGHCAVRLTRAGPKLAIRVSDDGVGLAPEAGGTASVGLASIRTRVDELGGACDITSSPAGTTVDVRLPLPE